MEELCLHVSMQAWQNLIPEKGESRNGDVYSTPLPDVREDYSYLPEWLHSAGTVTRLGEGFAPLTFVEIGSWAIGMRIELTRFETQALNRMSAAYSVIANNKKAECPVEHTEEAIKTVNDVNIATWLAVAKKG